MLLLKVMLAFGFLLIAFVMKSSGENFGLCEKTVMRRFLNTSVTPAVYYKVNTTIRECCFGFMTFGDQCIPMCQNVCINSRCVGNNKCQCHSGYYPVDHYRCLPKCEPLCGDNMACLAPNKCLCKPQYKKLNDSYCEPICSFTDDNFECINAKCLEPNVCECFEDYRRVSEFQCEPICTNCMNGECISPENCECYEGYEKDSYGICTPICDPKCLNSKCVAPNTCECDENFEKYLKSFECLEKQTIKDRQSCVSSCTNGSCSYDGVCVCDLGFEMFNGKCLKTCNKECINGKCLEDQCVCPKDYKLSENSTSCLPICAFEDGHDCISGICIAPQTCLCYEGFKFLDSRNCTCVPMCNPQCINGICTEDGCICHENFYNISAYECIKNCTEGLKWIYDECIEEIDFDSEEIDFDFNFNTTTDKMSSYEDETEDAVTMETKESPEMFFPDNETSSNESFLVNKTTGIFIEKSHLPPLPQLIPIKVIILFLSIIIFLIVSILLTFCFLYHRTNAKNIYHVHQKEKSSNCVYFVPQSEVATSPDSECSL